MPSFYDLMKYARTGIASPDMTGFDKLRARSAFGGYPVRTITGVPPISFKADGTPLTAWSIAGNGQQTGTPTPDAPIMPEFVGVRTSNLAPPTAQWVDGYVSSQDGSILPASGTRAEKSSDFIPVSASSSYYYKHQTGSFPEGNDGAWRAAALYDSEKQFITRIGEAGSGALVINTTAETAYIKLSCRTYGETGNTMLNLGSTALPFEPYGYAIEIEVT